MILLITTQHIHEAQNRYDLLQPLFRNQHCSEYELLRIHSQISKLLTHLYSKFHEFL